MQPTDIMGEANGNGAANGNGKWGMAAFSVMTTLIGTTLYLLIDHTKTEGHPGVLSQVAGVRSDVMSLRQIAESNAHRVEVIEGRQLANMERESRLDEAVTTLKLMDLCDRVAKLEARLSISLEPHAK